MGGMGLRGDKLHDHILWAAKDVFLEMGFERSSMDEVASRAETSKRSLYAHFESKEKLFLAFLEFIRGNFLILLRMPGDYSETPFEALVQFCGRYLEILLGEISIRMCRLTLAEAARFPEASALNFHIGFEVVHERLSKYLKTEFRLTTEESAEATQRLLAQILYPRFQRTLFGVDAPGVNISVDALSPDFDLEPMRKAVADVMESLPKR